MRSQVLLFQSLIPSSKKKKKTEWPVKPAVISPSGPAVFKPEASCTSFSDWLDFSFIDFKFPPVWGLVAWKRICKIKIRAVNRIEITHISNYVFFFWNYSSYTLEDKHPTLFSIACSASWPFLEDLFLSSSSRRCLSILSRSNWTDMK